MKIFITLICFSCLFFFHSFGQAKYTSTTKVKSIDQSLSTINHFVKNLEDSGYEIVHLSISNFPFKIQKLNIDDIEFGFYDTAFVKIIAIYNKDNLDSGHVVIVKKNEFNKSMAQTIHQNLYDKIKLNNGQFKYSWSLKYTTSNEFGDYHEISFDLTPYLQLIKSVEGTKDMGIISGVVTNIIKKENNNQLILFVYKKSKSNIEQHY